MRRRIFVLIVIFSLLFLTNLYSSEIKALNIQLFREDKILGLPINRASFWFEIKPGIKLGDNNFIQIFYSFSPTIIEKESFITVAINGHPLSSRVMSQIEKRPVNWKINIPKNLIKKGFNEISIMIRQRSVEGLCKDIDNDANWTIIHNSTFLHLEIIDDGNYKISDYPYPFLEYLSKEPVNFTFYLPKDFSKEELEALLELANGLGVGEKGKDLYFNVSTDNPYLHTGEKQILVGDLSKWDRILKSIPLSSYKRNEPAYSLRERSLLLIAQQFLDNSGLIYLLPSKDRLQLYISGKKEGLLKAVSYINNPAQVSVTEKNPVIINSVSSKEETLEKGGIIRLKDLGYENIILSGVFHQSASFLVKLPFGFGGIGSGSFIELNFSHSIVLEPNKSSITVYINGIPVKSDRLDAKNADKGVLRVFFPKEELNKKEWYVEIKVYHNLVEADCNKRYEELAWTRIEGDSFIYLVKNLKRFSPDLRDIWSFKGDKDIVLWLPQNPSDEELSLSATISASLGQELGKIFKWNVFFGNDFDKEFMKDKNIIFIGDMKDKRLEKLSETLWVVPQGDEFFVKKDLGFSLDGFITKVILQANSSPLNKNRAIYSIIFRDRETLVKLKRIIGNSNTRDKIYGQVSIVTGLGEIISSFLVKEEENIFTIFTKQPILAYLIAFIVAVLITMISIVFVKRRKKSY